MAVTAEPVDVAAAAELLDAPPGTRAGTLGRGEGSGTALAVAVMLGAPAGGSSVTCALLAVVAPDGITAGGITAGGIAPAGVGSLRRRPAPPTTNPAMASPTATPLPANARARRPAIVDLAPETGIALLAAPPFAFGSGTSCVTGVL